MTKNQDERENDGAADLKKLTRKQRAAIKKSWREFNKDGPSPAQQAVWREAEREAKVAASGSSHLAKAFNASVKLSAAERDLAEARMSSTRRRCARKIREQEATLSRLTAPDRETTKLLARYLRERGQLFVLENTCDIRIEDFFAWCADKCSAEWSNVPDRTIRYRLEHHYAARNKPGKPGRPRKQDK